MALWGNTDAQISVPKFIKRGQVVAVKVTAGGTGYTNGAAATFSAPTSGVTATGTITVVGGTITGVTITNPGNGYTSEPTVTVAGGSGATFDVVFEPIVTPASQIVFVDEQEARAPANRAKGIKTPGWTLVRSKVDRATGANRFFVDPLVAVSIHSSDSGDSSDDTVVGDAESFNITLQPTNASVTAPASTSFSLVTTEAEWAEIDVVFGALTTGQTTIVNGLTLTASGNVTSGGVARAFMQAINGETINPAINGTFSGTFDDSLVRVSGFSFDDSKITLGAQTVGYLDIASAVTVGGTVPGTPGTADNGSNGAGSFQWQVRVNNVGSFTNVTNGGVYSGATTPTLSISNSTGLNNNRYRCVCLNQAADTTITSKAVRLTVA